jgi:ribonuclease PH
LAAGASEQAARINSITLALIDSGVQLGGLLVAVAIAFLPINDDDDDDEEEEEEMVLDPTVFEEERATSTHVVTVSYGRGIGGTEGEIVGVESSGKFTRDQVSKRLLSLSLSLPMVRGN